MSRQGVVRVLQSIGQSVVRREMILRVGADRLGFGNGFRLPSAQHFTGLRRDLIRRLFGISIAARLPNLAEQVGDRLRDGTSDCGRRTAAHVHHVHWQRGRTAGRHRSGSASGKALGIDAGPAVAHRGRCSASRGRTPRDALATHAAGPGALARRCLIDRAGRRGRPRGLPVLHVPHRDLDDLGLQLLDATLHRRRVRRPERHVDADFGVRPPLRLGRHRRREVLQLTAGRGGAQDEVGVDVDAAHGVSNSGSSSRGYRSSGFSDLPVFSRT